MVRASMTSGVERLALLEGVKIPDIALPSGKPERARNSGNAKDFWRSGRRSRQST
jgi:hypothetical protein